MTLEKHIEKNEMNQSKINIIKTMNFKIILDEYNQNMILNLIKIINFKGIFVTGIPIYLDTKTLVTYPYLGQYGKIKSIIKSNNELKNKKFFSVFVEYETEFEAALAIISINNFKLEGKKKVQASYSTTKICKYYFLQNNCNKKNCIYFHGQVNKKNSILKYLNYSNGLIIKEFRKISFKKLINKHIKDTSIINEEKLIFPDKNQILKYLNSNLPTREILESDKEIKREIMKKISIDLK